jgi:hypothetical protein
MRADSQVVSEKTHAMPDFTLDDCQRVRATEKSNVRTRDWCARCRKHRRAQRSTGSVDPIAAIRTEEPRLRGSSRIYPSNRIGSPSVSFPWCVAAAGLGIGEGLIVAAAVDFVLPGTNPFTVAGVVGTLVGALALIVVKCLHQKNLGVTWRVTAAILGLAASVIVVASSSLAGPAFDPWQHGKTFDQILITFSLLQHLVCDGAIGLALLSAATAQGS